MNLFRCTRCLYPNTKPDLHFNEAGLCSACQAYDRRAQIDWQAKAAEFMALVQNNSGSTHDVIVACSGGKDSTAQIVKCLELGIRPLAVTASTDDLSWRGRVNLENISRLCDHVEVTVHKPTRAQIAAFALREIGDISWAEHCLIWSIPAREAAARHIPIVLYGECPQNEYGAGPEGSEQQTNLTPRWVHEFGGLLGLRLSDVAEILKINPLYLMLYQSPIIDGGRVLSVFMGAYFPWDGYENFQIARKHGFTEYPLDVDGSIFGYENLDNLQTGIHDYLRFLKFGYGRAVDIASNHIRRGLMTRDEAIERIKGRDGAYPSYYLGAPIMTTLGKIGMTEREFLKICDRFTNKEVVTWALSAESYQCFSGTSTDALKDDSSNQAAA